MFDRLCDLVRPLTRRAGPSAPPAPFRVQRASAMALLQCLTRDSDVGDRHVIISHGVSVADPGALAAALHSAARRPVAPVSLRPQPGALQRLEAAVAEASGAGRIPVVGLQDPWHAVARPLARALARRHRVTSVLLHVPFRAIAAIQPPDARAAALLEHGLLFQGTPDRRADSLEYVPRDVVTAAVDGLAEGLRTRYGGSRGAVVLEALRGFVCAALGLSPAAVAGVYVRPRRPYDVVVRLDRPAPARALVRHLRALRRDARAPAIAAAATTARPPVCLACTAARRCPLLQPAEGVRQGHPLCEHCLREGEAMFREGVPLPGEAGARAMGAWAWLSPGGGSTSGRVLTPVQGLVTGTLPNGLSYVVLRNKDPFKFDAYLQVNAAAVNETAQQQVRLGGRRMRVQASNATTVEIGILRRVGPRHLPTRRTSPTRRAPTPCTTLYDASYIPDASGPDALYDTVRRVVQCLKQHSAPPPSLKQHSAPPPLS